MKEKSDRHIRIRVSPDEYTFVREILWNTETAIDGTEEEAASIILGSMQSA